MLSDSDLVYFKDGLVFTNSVLMSDYFGISHDELLEDIDFILNKDSSFSVHFHLISDLVFDISFEGFLYWLLNFGVNLDYVKVSRYLSDFKLKRKGISSDVFDVSFGDDNFFGPSSFSSLLDFKEVHLLVSGLGYVCSVDIITHIFEGSSVVYCLLYNN